MPTLHVVTEVDAPVAVVLATSLDLDVEVAAGHVHRVRAVPGEGRRTSGRIGAGEQVRWQARLWGVLPFRHTSVIEEVVEDDGTGAARFTDSMVRGPFRSFRHVHELDPLDDGTRTRMTDRMSWTSPLGPLGRVADAVAVRRVLSQLLAERNAEVVRRAESA